jgi:prepilin-type N-terminal cleavage/methylation domain-containing protein
MKKRGFTLPELMVVVAIIAFLAMVCVPTFMRFLAKAKRAEAYLNLHALYAAQKAHWVEHGTYSTTLSGKGGVGWKPEGYTRGGAEENFYYTYGFPGAEGSNYFTGKLETTVDHLSAAHADKNGFLALAVGDIDGDGTPDIISIDHMNKITIMQDDLAD